MIVVGILSSFDLRGLCQYLSSGPSAKEQQWPDITGGEGLWDTPATRPPPSAAVATSNQLAQEKQQKELMRIKVQT